ncbi:MAG: hypothetical protein WD767_02070 [Alphaproteobacteria bacterium]
MNQWSQMKPGTLLKALTNLAERSGRLRQEKKSGAKPEFAAAPEADRTAG